MKFNSDIKDGIVVLTIGSVESPEDVEEFKVWTEEVKKTVHALYDKDGRKIPILVDVTALEEYKPEAFNLLAELLKHDEPYTSKIALLGSGILINAGKDALIAYTGVMTPIELFKSEQEAVLWLRA